MTDSPCVGCAYHRVRFFETPHSPDGVRGTFSDRCMRYATVYGKGEKPGTRKAIGTKTVLLPVTFKSETEEGARNKAIAFWNEETGKKEAKKERARQLGKRNAKP